MPVAGRALRSSVILAIGSELTHGWTRDTNSGDLAGELTSLGVDVQHIVALPDELTGVTDAVRQALATADLVVSTGGLGPTPDDLTREAIAAACGLEPTVDAELLAWLHELFARRGYRMPSANTKQAWLVPGASALPNPNGTAPGWWLERPEGRRLIALPGPPREMWPMWRDHALPRLRQLGAGTEHAWHTLRLTGIGESQLVGLIGRRLLRSANPSVATYARPDAVEVRVGAVAADGLSARELVEKTVAELRRRVSDYVFAEGEVGWPAAIGARLAGRSLTSVELGTGGSLIALLGEAPYLRDAEMRTADGDLGDLAAEARRQHRADLALAMRATSREVDTVVEIAIASSGATHHEQRTAFLAGAEGRRRAAIAACAALWTWLGTNPP